MKKNIKKLIALFLCLCVFGSGISVSATDTASPDTTQTTEPSTDDSGNETAPTNPSTGGTDTNNGSGTDSTTTPSDGTNTGSDIDSATTPSDGTNTGDTTDDATGNTDSGNTSSGGTSSDSTTPAAPVVKPLTLSGKLSATRTAQLKWNADDTSATYKLYRATKKTGKYSVVTTVTGKNGTVTYNNKKLTLGKTYYYQVKKIKGGKTVDKSTIVAVKIKLTAPASVKASVNSSNDVKLTWKKVSYATGYYIYRSTAKNGTYKKIATTKKLTYTDKSPASAKAYYYKIYAYKSKNSSIRSNASAITAAYTKTTKPLVAKKYESGKVKISWKKVTRATAYHVYKLNSSGKYTKLAATTSLYYYDEDVTSNTRYTYKVVASYKADNKTIVGFYSAASSIYTSNIDPNKKMVALTFDDGPGPYTQAIVNCLKKYDSRATFFVVGNRVNSYKSALKSAYVNGNEIGNHTYTHPTLTRLSTSNVKSQISKTDSAVMKITGEATSIVRAPGGATNSRVRNAINKPFIYWSIDTLDWKHRNKTKTINTVMKNVKDGDIILMHDIHKPSKEAALELIPKLKKAGYQIVTVSELAAYRGYNLNDHTTYYSFR